MPAPRRRPGRSGQRQRTAQNAAYVSASHASPNFELPTPNFQLPQRGQTDLSHQSRPAIQFARLRGRMRLRLPSRAVFALAAAIAAASPDASAQVTPARDTGPAGATGGTAVIRGRVVDLQTGNPLRRVRVSVAAPALGREGISASTDSDGRYELTDLPAGRFTLRVERGGYLL